MKSNSDERVVNNVMRHEYRVLTDQEKQLMMDVKDKALEFYQLIEMIENTRGPSRELSVAKTKIEEATMWATKDLTR
jgi:hypothetical protein